MNNIDTPDAQASLSTPKARGKPLVKAEVTSPILAALSDGLAPDVIVISSESESGSLRSSSVDVTVKPWA